MSLEANQYKRQFDIEDSYIGAQFRIRYPNPHIKGATHMDLITDMPVYENNIIKDMLPDYIEMRFDIKESRVIFYWHQEGVWLSAPSQGIFDKRNVLHIVEGLQHIVDCGKKF